MISVPDVEMRRLIGDAMTVPIRLGSLLETSAKTTHAATRVVGDVRHDAVGLAAAATEDVASAAEHRLPRPHVDVPLPVPTLPVPHLAVTLPSSGLVRVPHVSAHIGGADVHTIEAPELLEHTERRERYDFFDGIAPEVRHPGGSLPGANRWGEPLDPRRPVPVILVHGTAGGGQTNWGTYVPLLTRHGFSVFTLTYGAPTNAPWPLSAFGGVGPIEDSAAEFGAFVDKVLADTGAEQVDVVGHSQGTLMPNYYAKFLGGAAKIRRYISLAPLWHGTEAFGQLRGLISALTLRLGVDTALTVHSVPQMITGSDFMNRMNEGGSPYVPGIEYTNISTRHDEFVRPYTSGQVEGGPEHTVTNIVVQDGCASDHSDHLAICGSRRAATVVLNTLDDLDQHRVHCEVVPPFFG